MKRISFALVITFALLVPAGAHADPVRIPVDKIWISLPCDGPLSSSYDGFSICIYTRDDIKKLLKDMEDRDLARESSLKTHLQAVLNQAVLAAAIKEDQIKLVEEAVWDRAQVRYRDQIEALQATIALLDKRADDLRKNTEALEAKLKSLQPAPQTVPADSDKP